ncbi:hypothetical protein LAZ67_4001512 [Cordylochernes scorpioides]|uniref:Uncharacterized protein n=1 Tax=Cordylochernes scorpioides TaxID=51811 RepID=A0ABY6KC97_9ARAC|nr:hypothetical protein LAZ67_4001512 [Cordylochernes scorpioides]
MKNFKKKSCLRRKKKWYHEDRSLECPLAESQFYSNASSPSLNQDSPSHDSDKMKKSVQISRQLVQETLMDEGLRVAKELANQMDEESGQVIPPPPPALPPPPPRMDGPRPRGRPPKIERDYTVSTLTAPTLPPPSCMGPPSRPPSEPSHHGDPLLSNGKH